jgi:hypothetical protein
MINATLLLKSLKTIGTEDAFFRKTVPQVMVELMRYVDATSSAADKVLCACFLLAVNGHKAFDRGAVRKCIEDVYEKEVPFSSISTALSSLEQEDILTVEKSGAVFYSISPMFAPTTRLLKKYLSPAEK